MVKKQISKANSLRGLLKHLARHHKGVHIHPRHHEGTIATVVIQKYIKMDCHACCACSQ